MSLRFVEVTPAANGERIAFNCCKCNRSFRNVVAWADTKGPAFLAYWCPECKEAEEKSK